MAKNFPEMLPQHQEFIRKQKIFFVGSAPLTEDGHVNLSPKGHDVLRIFSPNEVAYLDLTGSGNETSAHLKENGRITLMFLAFEGAPMILRLYGKGKTILPDTPEWDNMSVNFDILPGARQIIKVRIDLVKTSCGFSVPLFSYQEERDTLQKWTNNKSEQELADYRLQKNSTSMDGLISPIGEANIPR